MSNTLNNAVINNQYVTTTTGTSAIPGNGSFITTNGTGQLYQTNPHGNHWNTTNQNQLFQIHQTNPPNLEVKGTFTLNGVDLEERLRNIEKVLLIPERDVKLESKYPKLKKLYDEYMAALGKYRTFESLKGDE
jgi:hypothetical protein